MGRDFKYCITEYKKCEFDEDSDSDLKDDYHEYKQMYDISRHNNVMSAFIGTYSKNEIFKIIQTLANNLTSDSEEDDITIQYTNKEEDTLEAICVLAKVADEMNNKCYVKIRYD